MNWSSVKNLLIAILVAANLFLIYNIVRQDRTRGYISEDEISGAAELLSERGLAVDKDSIPPEKLKMSVYESLYSDEYYTEAAQTLTGSERELIISLPSGGFSITAANGAVMEFDTEFGFEYRRFGNSVGNAYTEITAEGFADEAALWDELATSRFKTLAKSAQEFLDLCAGDDQALCAQVTDGFYDSERDYSYLIAHQLLDGHEVYSHYAICVFSDDELVYASGRWYFAPLDADYDTELIDQVNILFYDLDLLDADGVLHYAAELGGEVADETIGSSDTDNAAVADVPIPAVSAMRACYAIYWNADKSALYFIPAWQIQHIDGQEIVYNAANGTVYSRK